MTALLVSLLLQVLTSGSKADQGDNAILVPAVPRCPRCRIVLRPITVLGERDTSMTEVPQSLDIDERGRYYAALPNKHELPLVYAANGKLLKRIGRQGDGPGEFRLPAHIFVDAHDTVFIADWAGRLSVLTPDYRFARSFAFPTGTRALIVLSNGRVLANASRPDRETIGLPFHLFDRTGVFLGAIGDRSRPFFSTSSYTIVHRIAPTKTGFWSVPAFGNYLIEHWSQDGKRTMLLRRTPNWFVTLPQGLSGKNPFTTDPPVSVVEGLWEDSKGLLWVMIRTADPARHEVPAETVRTPEGNVSVPGEPDRVSDTIVEVIDPKAGILLVSQRFDQLFIRSMKGGRIAHIRENSNGIIAVEILELRLSPGPAP